MIINFNKMLKIMIKYMIISNYILHLSNQYINKSILITQGVIKSI